MRNLIFCSRCQYYTIENGFEYCDHRDNITCEYSFKERRIFRKEHPKDLNKHNDCKNFKKITFLSKFQNQPNSKVFCSNCIHFQNSGLTYRNGYVDENCKHPKNLKMTSSYACMIRLPIEKPYILNKNNDCKNYTKCCFLF